MTFRLSRRNLLAALGAAGVGAAIGRPGRAGAAAAEIRRLVIFYTAHGTVPDNWKLSGAGDEIALSGLLPEQMSPILSPLHAVREHLLVLEGVEMVTADNNRVGNEHDIGQAHSLTGKNMNPDTSKATSISIDQLVANTIGGSTSKKSLELGIRSNQSQAYSGPGQQLPCQTKPLDAFDDLFAEFVPGADQQALAELRDQRKSILDFVAVEAESVKTRLDAASRHKLDQHLTEIRDLEARLGVIASCEPFTLTPEERDHNRYWTYGEYGTNPGVGYDNVTDLMHRISVTALACDLTRVININRGQPAPEYFGGESGVDVHQAYAHQADKDATAKEMMTKYAQADAQAFADLVTRMRDANLLDSSLVVWCGELADGNHRFGPTWPLVMAGNLGGQLTTGRYLRYPEKTSHCDFWLAVAQKMGVDITSFGEPEYCTGPLPRLA